MFVHRVSACSCILIVPVQCLSVGRRNSVGIATLYGLDGSGFEPRWGQDFPHPSRLAPRPMGTGLASYSADVKERVEL
jgi:hypothetical protein